MLDRETDRDTMYFMDNTLKSNVLNCTCSFRKDPYKNQYLACLNGFDTKEIADGYSLDDIQELIEFLKQISSELNFKNTTINTSPLYTGIIE